jgi:ADP-heptose:LPS heptosyltransferase
VLNQWDLLDAIGVPAPDPGRTPVEMVGEPGAASTLAARLTQAGVGPDDRLIVVHVSAGNPFRRWPLERFVALVASLAAAGPGRRVVVTSGPSEREAASTVIGQARARLAAGDAPRVLACGDFTLEEFRALVGRAALYIGGDSGPLHIAATSTVPIVGIYGPTLPVRSAPWRDPAWTTAAVETDGLACRPCDQRRCVPGDFRCLTSIEPDQVISAAERVLTDTRRHSARKAV